MVQIDQLTIRVPGMGAAEGRRLGEEVARRVADRLPDGAAGRRLEEVHVRLTAPPGADPNQLADRIADQIVRQLKFAIP